MVIHSFRPTGKLESQEEMENTNQDWGFQFSKSQCWGLSYCCGKEIRWRGPGWCTGVCKPPVSTVSTSRMVRFSFPAGLRRAPLTIAVEERKHHITHVVREFHFGHGPGHLLHGHWKRKDRCWIRPAEGLAVCFLWTGGIKLLSHNKKVSNYI